MTEWGLSGKEAKAAYEARCEETIEAAVLSVIQAQLRKVVEEGEKPCLHNWYSEYPAATNIPKRACDVCWAELLKEAGL